MMYINWSVRKIICNKLFCYFLSFKMSKSGIRLSFQGLNEKKFQEIVNLYSKIGANHRGYLYIRVLCPSELAAWYSWILSNAWNGISDIKFLWLFAYCYIDKILNLRCREKLSEKDHTGIRLSQQREFEIILDYVIKLSKELNNREALMALEALQV